MAEGLGISESEARRAIHLTPAVDALERAARRQYGPAFAGIWRDYASGAGRVKLAFTNQASQRTLELSQAFPEPELIDDVDAARSLDELESIRDAISEGIEYWQSRSLEIVSIGTDLEENRVRVTIEEWNQTGIDELRAQYGDAALTVEVRPGIEIVADACERDSCLTERLRGGLIAQFPLDNAQCTLAFSAHRGGQGGPAGVLSAGHCSDLDRPVTHAYAPLGAVAWIEFSGNLDALWIDVVDTWPDTSRWVWQESFNHRYTITSRAGSGGGVVGNPICHSGYRRGYRCGQITDDSVTVNVGGTVLSDMKEDSICTGPGDSGGPVYADHRAHGIISATNSHVNEDDSYRCRTSAYDGYPPRTWYTGIYNTEQEFGVVVRTW